MQLWRKNRVELVDGVKIALDGVEYGLLARYNIKSPSVNPYNRYNDDDLGLNQLFVGDLPNKPYNGDPGGRKGIYHDKCYITYKNATAVYGGQFGFTGREKNDSLGVGDIPLLVPHSGWQWADGYISGSGGEAGKYTYKTLDEFDDWGERLVVSVTQEDRTNGVRYAVVLYADGSSEEFEIPLVYTVLPSVEYSEKLHENTWFDGEQTHTFTNGYVPVQQYIDKFGEPLNIVEGESDVAFYGQVQGRTYIFDKGIAFFLSPSSIVISHADEEGGRDSHQNGTRQLRILINLETGRTLMSKTYFIDCWSEMFELFVREDTDQWLMFVTFVVMMAAIVITILFPPSFVVTGSLMHAIMVFGMFLGSVGAMSGSRFLQAVGMVMSLGTAIYGGAQAVAVEGAMASGEGVLSAAAMEAARDVTLYQIVHYAFSEMSMEVFAALFALYQIITTREESEATDTDEAVKLGSIKVFSSGMRDNDEVMNVVKIHDDVMDLVKISI
jgi:hypothetical protein